MNLEKNIEFAVQHGILSHIDYYFNHDLMNEDEHENLCELSAMYGQKHILEWAINHGFEWNIWVTARLAEYGHLDILKWAREQGCPWNSFTCAFAANTGQLEILKWLKSQG